MAIGDASLAVIAAVTVRTQITLAVGAAATLIAVMPRTQPLSCHARHREKNVITIINLPQHPALGFSRHNRGKHTTEIIIHIVSNGS